MNRVSSISCIVLSFLMLSPVFQACAGNKSIDEGDEPWTIGKKEQTDPSDDKVYYPKADGAIRLMTYNVGSFSKYVDNSTSMIAAMIKEVEADIVGCNELDSINTRHNVNQIKLLADAIGGWNWHFGRAMAYKGGAYGNGVVTSSKISKKYTVTLEKGSGSEQRSLAVVELDKFVFGAAHLDHKSAEAQISQVLTINAWAQSLDQSKPIFFAGDMNAYPDSETLARIKEAWDIISVTDNTFGSSSPSNCIDYIFHYKKSASVKVLGSKVMTEFNKGDVKKASDHLPVYVDIQLN